MSDVLIANPVLEEYEMQQIERKEPKPEPLAVSPRQAAALVGVSERTLLESPAPRLRMGRRVLFPMQELREWLGRQAQQESVQW